MALGKGNAGSIAGSFSWDFVMAAPLDSSSPTAATAEVGGSLQRPTYRIASALFWRMLGVVYLIAFASLWTQISGLVGDDGILPAADFLDAVEQHYAQRDPPASPVWNVPTLAWISPHDGLLHLLCGAGMLFSLLLVAGLLPVPMLLGLWLCYLSLLHVGQVFLSFQWDILLLETGFVALFVAPLVVRSRFLADRHPPLAALWLVWWLLFRLMFESGVVKLTWNDAPLGPDGSPVANTWESLTALDYHYWTQPLPLRTSWYADKLPGWFQKLSVVVVLVIELGFPWLIFGPRRGRYVACAGITLLLVVIGCTGNYNFFNLLTVVLAITLLDDKIWPRMLRNRITATDVLVVFSPKRWGNILLLPFVGLVVFQGVLQVKQAVLPSAPVAQPMEFQVNISQFCLVNDYGLFRRMTQTRPEIVIEASADGREWKPYEFRWKPGDLAEPPRCNTPHQPRLDWQMWFEALRLERVYDATGTIHPRHMSPWFQLLLKRLAVGEPQVLGLLAGNPLPNGPAEYIRITLYQYRFTSAAKARETGHWWNRKLVWRGPAWALGP